MSEAFRWIASVRGTVYEIHANRKSLYSFAIPTWTLLEQTAKSLHHISYNKCVTAVDPETFRCRSSRSSRTYFKTWNQISSICWNGALNVHKSDRFGALAFILGLKADQVMACGDDQWPASAVSGLDWEIYGACDSSVAVKRLRGCDQWPVLSHGQLCLGEWSKWDYLIVYLGKKKKLKKCFQRNLLKK